MKSSSPLAVRMRPTKLSDFFGQEKLLSQDSLLFNAIEKNQLFSMILWGPPGSGKTTLASIIAETTSSHFISINAVSSGIADIKKAVEEARQLKNSLMPRETILFIDEIHRFNKAQQDFLLPFVEQRDIVLIGATTENPSFEVIAPLLSRSRVFVLETLSFEAIVQILRNALDHDEALRSKQLSLGEKLLHGIAEYSGGDARFALNALENLVQYMAENPDKIDDTVLYRILDRKSLLYDKTGEEHYNLISALHKSMRDSDADASVYWTVRMLEAGEDPKYIARRMLRFASEDIGLANNNALTLAVSVFHTVTFIGMPECSTALTQLAVYLARSPKNNTCYTAYQAARKDVLEYGALPVPLHIRNAPTSLMQDLGYGKGYQYAHDFPEARVDQQHLPDKLIGQTYLK